STPPEHPVACPLAGRPRAVSIRLLPYATLLLSQQAIRDAAKSLAFRAASTRCDRTASRSDYIPRVDVVGRPWPPTRYEQTAAPNSRDKN
ncbi:MAG: hypothetical protein ACNA77_11615, partial [Opitutales bacterium]